MIKYLIFFSFIFQEINAQLSAKDILMKSIKTHDKSNKWKKLNASFYMSIVRDKHADRFFTIDLNLPKNTFYYSVKTDSISFRQGFVNNKLELKWNESNQINESQIKKYELTQARTQYLKEVYEYLLLLPMRLQNDSRYLSETISEENFNGHNCYKITFLYEPKTESETWHFFIDKKSYILQGYQFYLKDKTADGEYIYLSDYEEIKGILMPKTKKWYWNKDSSFFRTDTILNVN